MIMINALLPLSRESLCRPFHSPADIRIGRLAVRSLYREVALAPKPGLVTPKASGSHEDMDFQTFLRSIHALRTYFPDIAACGRGGAEFAALQEHGIAAESAMLAATNGVNTHRGAIFNLGLLCAAAGQVLAAGERLGAEAACACVSQRWGAAILDGLTPLADASSLSHGLFVARRYGSGGARQEAAAGFPTARESGLQTYRATLARTGDHELAALQTLFKLMATLEDTNLLWRGGRPGLAYAQAAATDFITAGGVMCGNWRERAEAMERDFVSRRLSPGGSADLLGVTLFLAELDEVD